MKESRSTCILVRDSILQVFRDQEQIEVIFFFSLALSGSGVAGIANLPSLMSKSAIRGNLSALGEDVAAVHAKGLGFVLGCVS